MNILKNVLQDRVINPASHTRGVITTIAQISKVDEDKNICSIIYIDKDGYKRNMEDVAIRVNGDNDWCPAKNEYVIIEENGQSAAIIGKYIGDYAAEIKSKKKLEKDIHSDNSGGAVGGLIF